MPLNPVTTSQQLAERYYSYITTTLQLKDDNLNKQLSLELREPNRFVKGPFVEITPPYEKSNTIKSLIDSQLLTNSFYKLGGDLDLNRPLYLHQERAIKNLVDKKRNVIVSTGTGSGKTEAFLIPIINYLLQLHEKDELGPGVRALLLYPMNALANDQVKRLRGLLKDYTHITFGIYTGETKEKRTEGIEKCIQETGSNPLNNELVSREEMRNSPPHILITNYAMLEYLLIRPQDNSFFHGEYAHDWSFIIIDEAHVYTGAKAVEMSMLLRRLKQFVIKDSNKIQCVLTSATIGGGEKNSQEIANYANKLFDEEFSKNDVIFSKQEIFVPEENIDAIHLSAQEFLILYNDFTKEKNDQLVIKYLNKFIPNQRIDDNLSYDQLLFKLLKNEVHVQRCLNVLKDGAIPLNKLSEIVFEVKNEIDAMCALIDMGNSAREFNDSNSIIPARYHLFIRALEGGFFTFEPQKKLYLVRQKEVKKAKKTYKAFEIGTCSSCNEMFLIGQIEKGILNQPKNKFHTEENTINYFYLVNNNSRQITINEDETDPIDIDSGNPDTYKLCPSCGAVWKTSQIKSGCSCDVKPVEIIKANSQKGKLFSCPICGAKDTRNGIIRRFIIGEDGATSVLATELYLQLPDKKIETKTKPVSIWGQQNFNSNVRKMLIFADSRQAAAYFSTYLDFTYQNILSKKILTSILRTHKATIQEEKWNIEDLANAIVKYFKNEKSYTDKSLAEQKNIAWNWAIRELVGIERRNSLERLGFINFEFDFSKLNIDFTNINPLSNYEFTNEETQSIYQFMIDNFRYNIALSFPNHVELFPYMFRFKKQSSFKLNSSSNLLIHNWLPIKKGGSNTRFDYINRILQKKQMEYDPKELLQFIWESIFAKESPFTEIVATLNNRTKGISKQIQSTAWVIKPYGNNDPKYICSKCKRQTNINVANVCPTYRCSGELSILGSPETNNDHYKEIFSSGDIVPMRVHEHTAQLSHYRAAEVQSDFIKGKVNILSCSTTFELGVDVGDLETVFLKNVPPNPANYVQRAGRAGRHTNSTAFILTYARLNSHDFSHFYSIDRMLSGEISPPHFILKNEKIVQRHIFASALAFFWKEHKEYYLPAGKFFTPSEGIKEFKKYLDSRPTKLESFISKFIPSDLYEVFCPWKWTSILFNDGKGIMEVIEKELNKDRSIIVNKMNNASDNREFNVAHKLKKMLHTIESQHILSLFSRKNIIPKYGFPVDLVNLYIFQNSEKANQIELTRDLQIALSEYAPESELVANGYLWKSRYIKKVYHKEWLQYSYIKCKDCGYLFKILDIESENKSTKCPVCDGTMRERKYIVPEFGFIAEKGNILKPGMKRPEKTYSSRKFFIRSEGEDNSVVKLFNNVEIRMRLLVRGRLLVVNNGKGMGFSICNSCGYATLGKLKKHDDPWGTPCNGHSYFRSDLGYEFETDVVEIDFVNIYSKQSKEPGFWESILYGLLNGLSEELEIERNDIDGCIRQVNSLDKRIIIFDTVPGGAGHVNRILDKDNLQKVIAKTYELVERCECGGNEANTSCYGCLRNYFNQYCHEIMQRKYVIQLFGNILP